MAGENTAVDLNDPATWPDDIEALTALQDGFDPEAPAETGDTGEVAAKEGEEPETKSADEETPAEPEEKKSDDVQPDPVKPEPIEAKEETEDEEAEPELPILARDGKNTLPFGVLAGEREKNAKLSQRNAELEAELERLKTSSSTPAEAAKVAEAPVVEFEITAELQSKYDQLKEDWGEEIAENYIETKRIQHDNLKLREKLDLIERQATETAAAQRTSQEAQVQEAIDSSPDMALWQSEENGEMYDRALAVHQTLMTTDSEYASMSWYDRMQSLPKRTRAMYGFAEPATESEPEPEKPTVSQKEVADKAKAAADNAQSKPPHSMSDLPKGDTPVEKTEFEKLETADAADIQRKMLELSNNPEAYERYINSLM